MEKILGKLSSERELNVLKQLYNAEGHHLPYVQIKSVVTMDMKSKVGFGSDIGIMKLVIYDLMKYGLVDYRFDVFCDIYYLTDKGIQLIEENK